MFLTCLITLYNQGTMKILIAFDGSGFSHNALRDLQSAGLPNKAEACIFSVSEIYLKPNSKQIDSILINDSEVIEYIKQHNEQIERNLEETYQILSEAANDLRKYFPNWRITINANSGSAAIEILTKVKSFVPDLIVIGEQGLSWNYTNRLGGVSNKVLTQTNCNVRIAKSKNELNAELKIAVCFDGSPGSINAIQTIATRRWIGKMSSCQMLWK